MNRGGVESLVESAKGLGLSMGATEALFNLPSAENGAPAAVERVASMIDVCAEQLAGRLEWLLTDPDLAKAEFKAKVISNPRGRRGWALKLADESAWEAGEGLVRALGAEFSEIPPNVYVYIDQEELAVVVEVSGRGYLRLGGPRTGFYEVGRSEPVSFQGVSRGPKLEVSSLRKLGSIFHMELPLAGLEGSLSDIEFFLKQQKDLLTQCQGTVANLAEGLARKVLSEARHYGEGAFDRGSQARDVTLDQEVTEPFAKNVNDILRGLFSRTYGASVAYGSTVCIGQGVTGEPLFRFVADSLETRISIENNGAQVKVTGEDGLGLTVKVDDSEKAFGVMTLLVAFWDFAKFAERGESQ